MISVSWAWIWGGILALLGIVNKRVGGKASRHELEALANDVDGKVSREELQRYMEGQERLTEAHVKNTDANTQAVIALHLRVDGKEDKKT